MIASRFLVLALLVVSASGCGYSAGTADGDDLAPQGGGYRWASLYRQDIKTVAVPIFTNRTYGQGLEFSLSKAIINHLEARSPYKVVSAETADTVLEGEITNILTRTISSDARSSIPQEQLFRVRVNFTWKDLRTGRILMERRQFEQTAPFYPTLGEGRFVGEQMNLERLGLAIVQELQADW